MNHHNYLDSARQVFDIESRALAGLSARVDESFGDAVDAILHSSGRVVVCGMGKSGIIGRKIAATLASTGTPSFFMHPGEAYHGDLGMVTSADTFLAISYSGETDEVIKLIPFLKSNRNHLVALTGNARSTLARAAHSHLDVGVEQEACPLQLAPTSSTTAALAMGDALAVTLMKARGFRPENFARFHPGGSLGRRLLSKVDDEMAAHDLPFVDAHAQAIDVLQAMTRGRLGLAIVRCETGWGIITDGDIRRAVETHGDALFRRVAADLMSSDPAMVRLGTRVEDALLLMETRRINALLVSDGEDVVGVFKK
ncbi:KpsF/GutQ family sugar-phosphate isomerase [Burkholderia oklahomensis]|uniref:Sugar isomerase, KpsF/GutQ family protein n=1 Tax=Burkholderia oklahomensis TaxID=342113 RepID=A0AAI8B647_9BURK|nr:KpsF/GutQ family sugar-phosphate isomerase [Burkholderia oklahomensis]AIO66828.1 sugar isomerase, KpsF/GutQ family protein [Burkholderia oklahomensis]AJX31298.1 sugar isomerase, KpsF/GutQ family protein [Burkholderia oklahomensis C6786]AOI41419.1 arabinose-5-phosphate isomerase [Burkholderia oklahomensis EO147]AOI45024.1 arabinose-5-phosphate isomerase [Burkholderia oklahomensis C6786]KUY63907.1 arabinose-5-phosphate isomerase [Burkholderia oklahomensis EO147]